MLTSVIPSFQGSDPAWQGRRVRACVRVCVMSCKVANMSCQFRNLSCHLYQKAVLRRDGRCSLCQVLSVLENMGVLEWKSSQLTEPSDEGRVCVEASMGHTTKLSLRTASQIVIYSAFWLTSLKMLCVQSFKWQLEIALESQECSQRVGSEVTEWHEGSAAGCPKAAG